MIEGDGKRVTILCGESDRAGHSTLYEAIVRLLHNEGAGRFADVTEASTIACPCRRTFHAVAAPSVPVLQ